MHARTMGYKTVFTDHSLYGFADVGSIHMNKVLHFTLADIDQAICVSHTSKENTVLRSGIDPEKLSLVISRLVYRKGADLLVEVIPEVCQLHPNDGLKREIGRNEGKVPLQDKVEMLGAVPHALKHDLYNFGFIAHNWALEKVLPDDMIGFAEPTPGDMRKQVQKRHSTGKDWCGCRHAPPFLIRCVRLVRHPTAFNSLFGDSSQYRAIHHKVRLKWVKNRGFDHIIDRDTDIKAASLLIDLIARYPPPHLSLLARSPSQEKP
ncbi:hypothetical protein HPP92_027906 [Vanilla planifolia]|uniref:PIGA GPI anchor biosynthesis domain-containing protein n=1 Tax=Vanilla planifolia TaxID=51239 RepID=A0A835PD83_VANPL|nr:hypothetical protein HPP92_027906 [Vanilla planifolia]